MAKNVDSKNKSIDTTNSENAKNKVQNHVGMSVNSMDKAQNTGDKNTTSKNRAQDSNQFSSCRKVNSQDKMSNKTTNNY